MECSSTPYFIPISNQLNFKGEKTLLTLGTLPIVRAVNLNYHFWNMHIDRFVRGRIDQPVATSSQSLSRSREALKASRLFYRTSSQTRLHLRKTGLQRGI